MFFIYSGLIELLSSFAPVDTPMIETGVGGLLTAIGDGSFFGEVACFLTKRRTAAARAKTVAILYVITSEDLADCLDDFPETEAHLRQVAGTRFQRIEDMKGGAVKSAIDMSVVDEEDARTALFCAEAEEDDAVEKNRNEQWEKVQTQNTAKGVGGLMRQLSNKGANRRRSLSNPRIPMAHTPRPGQAGLQDTAPESKVEAKE
jgi:signal-transduction protein with cAMP-binding, CBS, and nucleotidyltransferase domain